MINRLLRYNLWFLFFLSVVNVIYYLFGKNLPDNSLVISSGSESVSYISYYFSSFIATISYYIGTWIVIPFLMYAFLYSIILSKREKDFDLFVPFVLVGFFFGVSYLFIPNLVGPGLWAQSNNYLDAYLIFFFTLLCAVAIAMICLRESFWIYLKDIQKKSERIGYLAGKALVKSLQYGKSKTLQIGHGLQKPKLKVTAAKLIKEGIKKEKAPINEDPMETITPRVSYPEKLIENKAADSQKMEVISEEKSSEASKEVVESKKPSRSRAQVGEGAVFQSQELINCISDSITHEKIKGPDKDYFDTIIYTIENKLQEFNVKGNIINILKGPVVDTFELELGEGIKASKVKGLEDDIGLSLNGAPIRVVYPLKGRSTIGIEVPRNPREFIYLDEILQSPIFNESKNRLPVAMGKDAFGEVSVVDLAGMPHMLVAGATGAGKSVFINTLLVSLIVKKSPRQLKLILIDPKQLELALFSTLPHLLLPVITEAKTAAISLLWAVEEMDRRYTILKEMGVKNIEGFNRKIKHATPAQFAKINEYYEDADDDGYELPYLVIVIDEFADLILTKSGKEIEVNVNRLAAKARAAGIHLVLATQRPSTDVITGVIKANFPTRIAFRVTTGHDSKTILDQHGAQKLLGKGDMLYKHGVDLLRLHSAFVDETEIEVLVDKLAEIPSDFNQAALEFLESGGEEEMDEDFSSGGGSFVSGTSDDPVYQEALQVVMETGSASASMLQRRLRVGYNRAANLIDELEKNGIVGPAQGSKPRKVLSRPE